MPLTLHLRSYRDKALGERSCVIDAGSATLGRGEGNNLVLEDPGKYISRVHARIEQRAGQYYLTDVGSNPSVVNDRLLGNGNETRLEDGDSVVIGEYRLQVELQAEAPAARDNDPVSESLTLAVFDSAPPSAPMPIDASQPVPAAQTVPSPTHDIGPPLAPAASRPDVLAAARILDNERLGEADMPFADLLGLDLFTQANEASLHPAFRGAESDHLSPEMHAFPAGIAPPLSDPQPARAGTPLRIPADYDPLADVLVMPSSPPEPATATGNAQVDEPEVSIRPAPTPDSSAGLGPNDDGVLQALLEGLGLPELHTSRDPRDVARLVGEMLREAVGGTMDVLMARALTKRDSHIDRTMIGAMDNNPLKFFPNSQSALSQMLNADVPAYLPGVRALAAAFDDIRAHELAVIVAMRAALAEVVQRFEPARIEARMAGPGPFDKLMPGTRKARLWDQLTVMYAELVRDGDEDVQRIFAEKFALAYQQQIARLRAVR